MGNNIFIWNNSAVTSSILKKFDVQDTVNNIFYANSRLLEFSKRPILLNTDGINLVRELKEKKVEYVFSNSEANANRFLEYCAYKGFKTIGANFNNVLLESSKSYSKSLMKKYSIQTSDYCVVENKDELCNVLSQIGLPCVIKADGMAKSLSAIVINDENEFYNISKKYLDGFFGSSSKRIIVEKFIFGKEVSIPLLLDGKTIKIFSTVRDYKKRNDNDLGPNTGGMGSVAPYNLSANEINLLNALIIKLNKLLENENLFYKGFMTINVIFTENDVYLLEINTRLGDSEGQVILSLLETDLMDVFESIYNQTLDNINLRFKAEYAVAVNIINNSYPNILENEQALIEKHCIDNILNRDIDLFFYKLARLENNSYIQGNDRFISLVSQGKTINGARNKIYSKINGIIGNNIHYRNDIGKDINEK